MDERIRALALSMGADVVAELPDVGHGALGAAQYAAYYRRRLEALRQTTADAPAELPPVPVPLDEQTVESLKVIISMLWPNREIGVGQLAAGLLRGMSVLILDQLIEQLEVDKNSLKKTLDTKTAIVAALKEMLNPTRNRQAAG